MSSKGREEESSPIRNSSPNTSSGGGGGGGRPLLALQATHLLDETGMGDNGEYNALARTNADQLTALPHLSKPYQFSDAWDRERFHAKMARKKQLRRREKVR